ncbi:MAG: DUF3325 family protein [Pseudomonadota bacterium]|mgnify:CR=1 FL=1
MDLLTITALLYVCSYVFFHAAKKRTGFKRVKDSLALQRTAYAIGWVGAIVALGLIVSIKGWEVGIPLWVGAWVVAAIISVFLEATFKKAHAPLAAVCAAVFATGLVIVPWGSGV